MKPRSCDERRSIRRPERGVAVVLALVAVSVATMLGVAYAASRDATLATSARLRESAAARAAAAGALEVAGAIVADEALREELGLLPDLPQAATRVLDALEVGDATVRAELVDLATGGPATTATRAAELVVEATVGAVRERVRAVGRLARVDGAAEADLDGSEFAILGRDSVAIRGESVVGLWRASPLAALAEPVRLGTAAGDGTELSVDRRAAVHGCVTLRRGAFPEDAATAAERLAAGEIRVPAEIHLPDAPLPEPPAVRSPGDAVLDGLVAASLAPAGDVRVPARASLTLRGASAIDVAGNLFVERGARVLVETPLAIVVRGNLVLDACSIECARGASLAIVVCGDATVAASYLGGVRGDPSEGRDASGLAAYDGGAEAVVLYGHGAGRVLVTDGSVVKGQVYAPRARLALATRSAVYGRLLGAEVTLDDGVALFYDPALDTGAGWTRPTSGLWRADGTLEPATLLVASLDAAPLLAFTEATGVETVASAPLQATLEVELEHALAAGATAADAADDGASDESPDDDRAATLADWIAASGLATDANSAHDDSTDEWSSGDGSLDGREPGSAHRGRSRWSRLARLLAEVRSHGLGWRRAALDGYAGFVSLGFEPIGTGD
jgi:hypothetical protein